MFRFSSFQSVAFSILALSSLQGQSFSLDNSASLTERHVNASHSSLKSEDTPIEVRVSLVQDKLRVGDPILISYRFINHSKSRYNLILPNEGRPWLKLHLKDSQGKEIGVAEADDFAGQSTIWAVASDHWSAAFTTRLHLENQREEWLAAPRRAASQATSSNSGPSAPTPAAPIVRSGIPEITPDAEMDIIHGTAFADHFVLHPRNFDRLSKESFESFVPGSYVLTAEINLPYREDAEVLVNGKAIVRAPNVTRFEARPFPNGKLVADPASGKRNVVWNDLPAAPSPTGQVQQTIPLSLTVQEDIPDQNRTQFRLETQAFSKRLINEYETIRTTSLATGDRPLPLDLKLPPLTEALQGLFSRYGVVARREQIAVADEVMEVRKRNPVISEDFYRHVANLGTLAAADFLADQGWERGRRDAIEALGSMTTYSGHQVQQKVRELFAQHSEKVPPTRFLAD